MTRSELLGSEPLYVQVSSTIKKQIDQGIIKPGDRLMPEVKLQSEFNVSRVTIRKALDKLDYEGYLIRIKGRGTFVKKKNVNNQKSLSLTRVVEGQGKNLTSQVISLKQVATPQETIPIFGSTQCVELIRLRMVDGVVIMYERTLLPEKDQFIFNEDLTGSLYDILRKNKVYPDKKGLDEVTISRLDNEMAKLFNVQEGMSVIHHRGLVYENTKNAALVTEEFVRVDLPDIFKYYL